MADGEIITEPSFMDMLTAVFRLSPKMLTAGDAEMKKELSKQAEHYADRVISILETNTASYFDEMRASEAWREQFDMAFNMLSPRTDEEVSELQQGYIKAAQESPRKGLQGLKEFAQKKARALANDHDLASRLGELDIPEETEKDPITNVIARLPNGYVKALHHLPGVDIVVNEDQNGEYDGLNLIGVKNEVIQNPEMLERVLREEIRHLLDGTLGFTNSKTWRDAVRKQFHFRLQEGHAYAITIGKGVQAIKKSIESGAKEQDAIDAITTTIINGYGNNKPDLDHEQLAAAVRSDIAADWSNTKADKSTVTAYEFRSEGHMYPELLADVLREYDGFVAQGQNQEQATESTRRIFGELAPLAVTFNAAVEHYAENGTVPRALQAGAASRTAMYM